MGINIIPPSEPIKVTNLIVTIYGEPGVGKTSLAYSASKPLMLDFDLGAQRALGRKHTVRINNWSEIANISAEDLAEYDTVIIDTLGSMLNCLIVDLIKHNPKLAQRSGALTQKGYGDLGVAFSAFLNKIKSFHKDIIIIAHSEEKIENDERYTRLSCSGNSAKTVIHKDSDLIGYMFARERKRILDFNFSNSHLGKNSAQIEEQEIPNHANNQYFMLELLKTAKENMNRKSQEQIAAEQEFEAASDLIKGAQSLEDVNKFFEPSGIRDYIFKTPSIKVVLNDHAVSLGFAYDKSIGKYVLAVPPEAKND
jgi:hypothetical protein